MPQKDTAIQPTRQEDFAQWYQQVIKTSDVAEHALSRGCMVIKPWGYGIWEIIQSTLDTVIKDTGHENAYFPLLIPLSLLEKEANHIQGFATECAVVTHSKLTSNDHGKLEPSSPLDEPYIIRPTSEAIIGHTYARWVNSYRDLPLLINQWANVVRWEMRTRMFIRTTEFLWQEGHTVHATSKEAHDETLKMLGVYEKFITQNLAMPLMVGRKTPDERFPGAEETYTVEALMQDGKALQAGTSHFLGQNFSKAYDICFQTQEGSQEYAWTTSWGVSTRLMGGLIMSHSDDDGLVLPPAVAPTHVIIQPILRGKDTQTTENKKILSTAHQLCSEIKANLYLKKPIRAKVDERDMRHGPKNWNNIKRGVPIRINIGLKEIQEGCVTYADRIEPHNQRSIATSEIAIQVGHLLQSIQQSLFQRANTRMQQNTTLILSQKALRSHIKQSSHGWVLLPWCNDALNHPLIKELLISPRCIPSQLPSFLDIPPLSQTTCLFTQNPATDYVIFAKAY